jgi:hypothetical protein
MADLRNHVDNGFTEVCGELDATAIGKQHIVDLLTILIGDQPQDTHGRQ